jgi:arsenate reductase (thioredoxin)
LSTTTTAAPKDLNPQLAAYVKARAGEFGQIPAERKERLDKLFMYVHLQIAQKHSAKLLFIYTHNSRRSHIAQIWAQTAALYYGVAPVETFSGGMEATAFNPRAVAALQRVGFEIVHTSPGAQEFNGSYYYDSKINMRIHGTVVGFGNAIIGLAEELY